MNDQASGQFGLFGGSCFGNSCYFETLLMLIILFWLLKWLFCSGFGF